MGFGWPIVLGDKAALRLVTDRHGNVLAAAEDLTGSSRTVDIIRLEHGAGHVQWRRTLGRQHGVDTEIGDLGVTTAGDALFTGVIDDANGTKFLVTRLDGRTGKRLWRTTLEGSERSGGGGNVGRALAADRKGDVVAAGALLNAPYTEGDFAVVKLDGASGAESWRFSFAGPPAIVPGAEAQAVVVDAAGDAIAAGILVTRGADAGSVVKLAGGTGQLIWRRDIDTSITSTSALVLDDGGDVYLAVDTLQPLPVFGVVKLAGATGEVLWIARVGAPSGATAEAVRVLVDESGAVYASGSSADAAATQFFTVVRLDASTGAVVWNYETTGTAHGGSASQLGFLTAGLVVAGGVIANVVSCDDVLIVALDMARGAPVWSRTFDGSLVARSGCAGSSGCGGPAGPPADNDMLTALTTDQRGRVFASMALVDATPSGARTVGSIRRFKFR